MSRFDRIDDPRRRLLIQALIVGLVPAAVSGHAGAQVMPPEQSIYRITGLVTVNGRPATLKTRIGAGDTVETGEKSEVVFVVGGHSMLMRERSTLVVEGAAKARSVVLTGLRMLTGKLLAVSRKMSTRVTTSTATIGIRGTGWYAEADPDQTYFCTCYGTTDVSSLDDPLSTATVNSKHHDRPLYILREGPEGQRIRSAPVTNHADAELLLIETLVGRRPPFMPPPR